MARDTAGFTWPPGNEDKAESEGGVQRVGGGQGGRWHDIPFIIREGPSHLRADSRRGAAPGGGARSYYVRSRAKIKKEG